MATLAAARVVTPSEVLTPGVVEVEDGRVVSVGPTTGAVPDRTLLPGFVDLQVNGCDDVDVASAGGADWDRLDALLLGQGVTTWCPTLVSAALDGYRAPLARVDAARSRPADRPRPTLAGVHLEGPFLGAMPGAHRRDFLVGLDPAWLATLPEVVRIVTLGPELAGAAAAIGDLAERGIVVGMGHSAARWGEVVAAIDAGARLVTHCFNAMPPLHHREPGLVGAALSDSRLTVSLIADLVHVHPAVLAVALRAKGRGGAALVTDSVACRAAHVGAVDFRFDGQVPRLADGTLAGSALTMDRAVRNVVEHCDLSLVDAAWAASTAAADLLGLHDRGRLAAGMRADVVALDGAGGVERVWVAGQLAWAR